MISLKSEIQFYNGLKEKNICNKDDDKSKNLSYIFKNGKWHLETKWIGYTEILNFLNSLGRSRLDGLKIWVTIRKEINSISKNAADYKPLFYSLKIRSGKNIPTELIGKRVYIQNNDYYFKNGWYYKKFQKRKNCVSITHSFYTSLMQKVDKDWLQVPSWTAVKIRHAIFQQFYKEFEAFIDIKEKKHNAKSKRKPNLYIGKFELDESENSWIRAFYDHIRGLKTKEAALINLRNNFPTIFNYFESTRYESSLSDKPSNVITDTPSRIDILMPRKSIVKKENEICLESDHLKTISSISAQNVKNSQNSKQILKNINITVFPKDSKPPFDLNKDLIRILSEFAEDILFLTPYEGFYAPDLFKLLRSLNTYSLTYLLNALIISKGYSALIVSAKTEGIKDYYSTSIMSKQLPEFLKKKTFHIFPNKAYRGTVWSYKISSELFIPVRATYTFSKKKTYTIIDSNSRKPIRKELGVQSFIRKSLGIEGIPTVYVSDYNIDMIGAAARTLLQEKYIKKTDAPNVNKLNEFFKENPFVFKANRDPDFLDTNFTFLVAITSQFKNLKEWFETISEKSQKLDNEIYLDFAKIQLKNSNIIDEFKWSVNDVKKSGALDLIFDKPDNEIQTNILDSLKEGGYVDYFLTALFINKELRMFINNNYNSKLCLSGSYFMTQHHRTPPTKMYDKFPEFTGFTFANIPDATSGIFPGIGATEYAMFKVFRHAFHQDISKALAEPLKCHSCSNQFYKPFQMSVYIRDDFLFLFNRADGFNYSWKKKLVDSNAHGVIVISLPDLLTDKLNRFSEVFASAFVRYRKYGPIDTNDENEVSKFVIALKEKINAFQPYNPINQDDISSLLSLIPLEAANPKIFTRITLLNYLKTIFD